MDNTFTTDLTARALAAIGALNWGLVGATGFNLVSRILGEDTLASRLIYLLVGAAGLWSAYRLIEETSRPRARIPLANIFSR